ncbi:MAG: DUF3883 domain-containing protein, partial [Actinomycetia bacterium]|nr:DUF3883 domain-containing protein [Actinomycetes bacterium]
SHDDRLLKLSKEVMGQFTRAKQFRYQPIFLKNYIVRAMDAFGGSINLERTRDDTEIWRLKLPNQLLASAQPTLPTSVNNAQWTFDPPKYEINIPLPTMLTPQHQVVKAIANYTKDQFRNDQLRGAAFIANADEFAELTVDLIYTYSIKQRAQDKDTHADSGYALAQQCIAVRMRMHNGEFLPSEVIDRPVMHRDLQPAKDIPPELIPPIDSKLIAGARQKVLSHQTALRDEIKQQIDMSSLARYEASKEQLTNEKQRQQDIIDSKKQPQKNRDNAQKRVIELEQRLNAVIQRRRQEQEVTSQAPQLVAGYVIIPQHMLPNTTTIDLAARRAIERKAISIITEEEQAEGRKIIDVSSGNHGYDLLSTREGTPDRKLEVKGRFRTQPDPQVSLTGNEFACMRNSGDEITLCAVIFDNDTPYPEVIRIPGSRFESSDPRLFDHYSLAVSSLRELSQTTSNPK